MKKFLVSLSLVILGSTQFLVGQSAQFSMPSARQKAAVEAANAAQSVRSGVTQGNVARPNSSARKPHPYGAPGNPPVNPVAMLSGMQIASGGRTEWSAVSADFNNDGKPDIAAPIQTGSSTFAVSVALNAGNGSFGTASVISNPHGVSGDQILAGDFNNDGNQDLIIVHATSPATYEVWLGHGDGTFNVQSNTTHQITTTFVAGGALWDVNGDGKPDMVFVDVQTPNAGVYTLLSNGDGTFQAPTSVTVSNASGPLSNFVFADFNGDGILDFAASEAISLNHPQDIVYLGQSGGTYGAGTLLVNPDFNYDVCNNAAGDLNGDGKAEIVSANCSAGGAAGTITVYVNNGNGTFKSGVYYSAATETVDNTAANISPLAATIADVNGDGFNDIVSSNAQGGDITILLGKGDGTLTSPVVGYSTGGTPKTSALVADFNGDGKLDLVVPDNIFSFVYLQGYGDGTFRAPLDFYSPVPGGYAAGATTVASGDLNGDGYPDFVVGNVGYNHSGGTSGIGVTVFLSNPDGSLQPGTNYGTGGSFQGVAIADFNGDGKLDFATVNQSNNNVSIYRGAGDGTFGNAASYVTGGTSGISMVAGDFNKDGFPDVAIANTTSHNVSVLLNDGTGALGTAATYSTGAANASITAADVNNDGILDLIVTQFNPGVVAVLLGNANGTFQPALTPAFAFNYLGPAALADFDGDGKLDLAVVVDDAVTPNEGIAVARGNGDGTFGTPILYSTTLQNSALDLPVPGDIKIVDLNGDGHLDLVYSNTFYGTVGVLYNTGTNAFASGMFYDPVEVGAGSSVFALALADVNHDGATDVVAANNNYAGMTVLLNGSGSTSVVTSSLNSAPLTKPIPLTSTVSASVRGVTGTPTGTATFYDGATSLGTATLSNGVASLNATTLSVGTHSITAQYSGDSNFHSSTSAIMSQVVTLVPDSTTISSSQTTAGAGQAITITPTVTASVSGVTAVPTGSVTYLDGTTSLGSFPLTASLVTSSLAVGTHSITAQYSGDANFVASTSPALTEVIVSPDFTLGAASSTVTVTAGTNANYTLSVTPTYGYSGTVSFTCPATLPTKVTCSFSPASVSPSNNTYPTTTLTLGTTAAVASSLMPPRPNSPVAPTLWASLTGLGLFGIVLAGAGNKRNRRKVALLGILLLVMTFTFFGCGGSNSSNNNNNGTPGTPAGSYTVTVTAAGAASGPTHTTTLTLIVQ